jgi:hypothetical protein
MTLAPEPAHDDFRRLPGLYRRWELAEVCVPERSYRIEHAGTHGDGTALLALYVSSPTRTDGKANGIRSAIPGQPCNGGCSLRCLKALTRLLDTLSLEGAPETPQGAES